ncbi:MAG: hypothetical protein CSA32_05170 [Desulfobulbus propionicus]|nr:MAG: hypothetical protein CSA32_05170 [Desulfobulbus propionicus]
MNWFSFSSGFDWLVKALANNRWGGQALISLYISMLSGIVLALQYDVSEPFYSTTTIELVISYGSFWRALHYYSSQAFFLLLLGHISTVLAKNTAALFRPEWIRLCSSLPCCILLLFTGYVLRGDATGEAAGVIAENICLSIPLAGKTINDCLFDIQQSGMLKVYVHHLIGLVALGGWAIWPHLKRYPVLWRNHVLLVILLLAVSVFFAAPIEPDRTGLLHIAGPWFFLGLQELLRYLPAFIAGVLVPLLPLLLIYFFPSCGNKRLLCLLSLLLWMTGYTIITLISWYRTA